MLLSIPKIVPQYSIPNSSLTSLDNTKSRNNANNTSRVVEGVKEIAKVNVLFTSQRSKPKEEQSWMQRVDDRQHARKDSSLNQRQVLTLYSYLQTPTVPIPLLAMLMHLFPFFDFSLPLFANFRERRDKISKIF